MRMRMRREGQNEGKERGECVCVLGGGVGAM